MKYLVSTVSVAVIAFVGAYVANVSLIRASDMTVGAVIASLFLWRWFQ